MLYVNYTNLYENCNVGIKKKILAQCSTFMKKFGTVYYTMFAGQTMYLFYEDKILEKEFALTRKMCNEAIAKWIVKYHIKRLYIRYALSDMFFLDFLEELA